MLGSDENVEPTPQHPAGLGLAFATQLGGCGGGGEGGAAGAPAPPRPLSPTPPPEVGAGAPLLLSQDAELLMTQPEVVVVDSRLVGHGRRAQVCFVVCPRPHLL